MAINNNAEERCGKMATRIVDKEWWQEVATWIGDGKWRWQMVTKCQREVVTSNDDKKWWRGMQTRPCEEMRQWELARTSGEGWRRREMVKGMLTKRWRRRNGNQYYASEVGSPRNRGKRAATRRTQNPAMEKLGRMSSEIETEIKIRRWRNTDKELVTNKWRSWDCYEIKVSGKQWWKMVREK